MRLQAAAAYQTPKPTPASPSAGTAVATGPVRLADGEADAPTSDPVAASEPV